MIAPVDQHKNGPSRACLVHHMYIAHAPTDVQNELAQYAQAIYMSIVMRHLPARNPEGARCFFLGRLASLGKITNEHCTRPTDRAGESSYGHGSVRRHARARAAAVAWAEPEAHRGLALARSWFH